LHQEYKTRFFGWEPLFLLQRLMVACFVMVFIQAKFAIRRIIFGVSITAMYLVMLLSFRPYLRRELNYLAAIGSQLALVFFMLVALHIRIFDDIAD
jgi:hypothetical protein